MPVKATSKTPPSVDRVVIDAISYMAHVLLSETAGQKRLSFAQAEEHVIHKFNLRGKAREVFLLQSKEWGGRSLV